MAEAAKKRSGAVAPFYSVAITWVVYALAFDLYTVWNFLFLILLSGGVFLLVRALCGDKADTPVQAAQEEEKKEEDEPTGNEELDKMIRDGRLAIAEMKRLDDNIADPGISADIVRLEQVSARIFDEVRTHPEKLPQIRRFLDYYLPTTLKLLNAYDRMSGTGVSGENIDTTLAKVEGMMRTIVAAFEKQLDSLYGAEALDISTDITVLENMMAREGLVDSPLKAEPDEKKETDIRLEL